MLAVVVIVFAFCWLPYRMMVMHNSFTKGNRWDSEAYIFFSKTMIFINCAINPILYNVMSLRFRSAFKQLLRGNSGSKYSARPQNSVGVVRNTVVTEKHSNYGEFGLLLQSSHPGVSV